MNNLKKVDPLIANLIQAEEKRQLNQINLIPSENFTSRSAREAVGSVLMHKYSEGNIGKRYYEGNNFIDQIEQVAIDRAKKLFKLPSKWGVNMQALSGSNANLAVYLALLEPGDTIMGMFLPDGGHLSHGWSYDPSVVQDPNNLVYKGGKRKVNITSRIFNTIQYKTDPKTKLFDYDEVEKIAQKYKPKLIISGGTAYPRNIDYKRMKQIADRVGALYMADIAHEAGLVAAGVVPSPVGIADVVTMTTHKTLRAARGAIILADEEIIAKVDRSILPGLQGGPFNNNIAGIAVALGEALEPSFKKYAKQILNNASYLAESLTEEGFSIVTGGTDKHLLLIDLSQGKIHGKYFARALAIANIVANMNTMPGETRSPADPSALRVGTPFVTTQGMKEPQMKLIARLIKRVYATSLEFTELKFEAFQTALAKDKEIKAIQQEVSSLMKNYQAEL